MQFLQKIEKQVNLSINKNLSSCYKIEHGFAGALIIRNSKLESFKYRFTSNSPRLYP